MKKIFYIALFMVLGIILSFIVHAVVEIVMITLLEKEFETFNLGLSWVEWYLVHDIGAVVLFILGVSLGYIQGKHWWRVIYIEKRYPKKLGIKR